MKKSTAVFGIALAMGIASSADARGPKLSADVEAFCGDPVAVDAAGVPFATNVGVTLTDVSDDNGPVDATVGLLEIVCTAAVKSGRGKPDQVEFTTISIPDPAFGTFEVTCPTELVPEGAHEWKATATASGGDLTRARSDNCEEVPVN